MADEMLEFAKAYEYCFFKVPIKTSEGFRSFVLTGIDRATQMVKGRLITRTLSEKPQTYEYSEFRRTADPIIPTAGYVLCNLDRPSAVFLSIEPLRQYRKALYFDQGGIAYVPNGSLAANAHLTALRSGEFDTILKAYSHQLAIGKPPFLPIRGAVDLVESGEAHSCPISRFFAVSLTRGIKVPVLWHKNSKEGVFIGKQLYVTNKILPFKEFFLKKWDMMVRPIAEAPRV